MASPVLNPNPTVAIQYAPSANADAVNEDSRVFSSNDPCMAERAKISHVVLGALYRIIADNSQTQKDTSYHGRIVKQDRKRTSIELEAQRKSYLQIAYDYDTGESADYDTDRSVDDAFLFSSEDGWIEEDFFGLGDGQVDQGLEDLGYCSDNEGDDAI